MIRRLKLVAQVLFAAALACSISSCKTEDEKFFDDLKKKSKTVEKFSNPADPNILSRCKISLVDDLAQAADLYKKYQEEWKSHLNLIERRDSVSIVAQCTFWDELGFGKSIQTYVGNARDFLNSLKLKADDIEIPGNSPPVFDRIIVEPVIINAVGDPVSPELLTDEIKGKLPKDTIVGTFSFPRAEVYGKVLSVSFSGALFGKPDKRCCTINWTTKYPVTEIIPPDISAALGR